MKKGGLHDKLWQIDSKIPAWLRGLALLVTFAAVSYQVYRNYF